MQTDSKTLQMASQGTVSSAGSQRAPPPTFLLCALNVVTSSLVSSLVRPSLVASTNRGAGAAACAEGSASSRFLLLSSACSRRSSARRCRSSAVNSRTAGKADADELPYCCCESEGCHCCAAGCCCRACQSSTCGFPESSLPLLPPLPAPFQLAHASPGFEAFCSFCCQPALVPELLQLLPATPRSEADRSVEDRSLPEGL
mmetsp:Transcript_70527/g.189888  ORF Transcript_70527/g.189888 Transcript_70527/m.189888 type:complete len:201 (-) Transcript_70527:84-686(-)